MNYSDRGVQLIIFPVILLSGIASGIACLVWLRMLANLFGVHQFSITSIFFTLLISLAAGSRFWGWLADRMPNRLILFVVCQGIVGLFSFGNPLIFHWLQEISGQIIGTVNPDSFGLGIYRIGISLVVLIIPVSSIGGVFPVLTRYFTEQTVQSGNILSIVLSLGTAGISIGLLLCGIIMIPRTGMHSALQISAMISLIIAVIILLIHFRLKSRPVERKTIRGQRLLKNKNMLFRKNRAVLETGARLTRAMLRIHAVHGFAAASLLILACRMINDYAVTGNSYRQLLVISVYLGGLSSGSFFYRAFTRRLVNGYLLMASLEILTAFSILFSVVLMSLTGPVIFQPVSDPVIWWKTTILQLIPVISILFLPAFIMGMLLPLAGRIYPRRLPYMGRNIGRLDFLFFSGAITGIWVSHYFLLPLLGSFYSIFFLILVSLLSGFYLLLKDSRLIRGFRLSYTVVTLALITGILFFLVKSGWINREWILKTGSVSRVQEGSSALVKVYNRPGNMQTLTINGIDNLESGINGLRDQKLPAYLSCILDDEIRSALVVGFGMGLTASAFEDCGIAGIRIAEIFPEILTLSSVAFATANNDILTSSHVDIFTEDPRIYLSRTTEQFDLITSGYYDIRTIPEFFTQEFFRKCHSRLTDKGTFTQLISLRGICDQEFRSIVRTCLGVFPEVSLWYISRNKILLLAEKQKVFRDYCYLAERFSLIDHQGKLARIDIPDIGSLLGIMLMDGPRLEKFAGNAPEIRDDKPFIEFTRTPLSFSDHMLYRQLAENMDTSFVIKTGTKQCAIGKAELRSKIVQTRKVIKDELLNRRTIQ